MNIPKSYEALAADLASEKIISKTLQGQKESYMMLADGRKFDLDALQQRLTVSEQRSAELESEAREMLRIAGIANQGSNAYNRAIINLNSALKPAAEVEGS